MPFSSGKVFLIKGDLVGDPDGSFLDEVDLVGTDVLVNSLSEIDSWQPSDCD